MRSLRGSLAAVVALAVATSGCDGDEGRQAAPSPAVAQGCSPEEHPPLQAGSHLIGDTAPPVPYSSNPPTSGWHASGRPEPGVHDEPLTDPQIVSLLEAGQVVAVYDPDALPAEAIADLEELATGGHTGRLSVTPANQEFPAPVTLTAWGVLQRCDRVSAEAVTSFVLSHYGQTDAH